MNQKIKISQLPAKGANLDPDDLLEIAEFTGTGYVSKSITGQEIIDAAAGSGVTDVTATDPIISTGGSTPNISIPAANGFDDGFLKSGDWNTFNNKQNAITLTTTGTSGAATLVGSTLNIPQYSGGGGGGIHALVRPTTGQIVAPIIGGTVISSGFNAANRLTAIPFIPANTFTSSNLYLNVTNFGTGAIARILIYSNLNGFPNTKLYESANLDCSSNGIKTATTSFTFTAGVTYWICSHSSLGNGFTVFQAASLLAFNVISPTTANTSYIYTFAIGSAPATLGAPNSNSNAVPAVFITIA